MDVSGYLSQASFWTPDASLEPFAQTLFSPVAYWTIHAARPGKVVQLGIREPGLYIAFCEAVKKLGLGTSCVGVDPSHSDEPGTVFMDAALQRLHQTHNRAFETFSKLMRIPGDEVIQTFADASIDLLHPSDAFSVERFRRDFQLWLPKLSDRAILLLPGTCVQSREKGTYRFFQDLSRRYPSFEFTHGDGLGLIALGKSVPEKIRLLLDADGSPDLRNEIRMVYSRLGRSLVDGLTPEAEKGFDGSDETSTILGLGMRGDPGTAFNATLVTAESRSHHYIEGEPGSESAHLDILAKQESLALREENYLLREENALLYEAHRELGDEIATLRRENPGLRHHLAHYQHHHAAALEQLNDLRQSTALALIEKSRSMRGRFFPQTRLHGRCLELATRFVRITIKVGPRTAVKKATQRVFRKVKVTLNLAGPAQPAVETIPVYRSIVPKSPALRFEDLPWTYTGDRPRESSRVRPTFKILLVGHSACRTGAPMCLLRLSEELSKIPGVECWNVLRTGGELSAQFAKHAPTLELHTLVTQGVAWSDAPREIAARFREFSRDGVAVCNTMAVSEFHEAFGAENVRVLSWIHELPTFIDILGGSEAIERIKAASRRTIVPANVVREALMDRFAFDPSRIQTLYYGLDAKSRNLPRQAMRTQVRAELDLPDDARIVLGCGTLDLRKGADLFVQMGQRFLKDLASESLASRTYFLWFGFPADRDLHKWLLHDIEVSGLSDQIRFVGTRDDLSPYFLAADLFALTSREDPCPFANLEAMESALAVVAFQGSGGAPEVLGGAGIAVPYLSVGAMAYAAQSLLSDDPVRAAMGERGRTSIRRDFTWPRFMDDFLGILKDDYGYKPMRELKVSVIVPNYRHAPFLEDRLQSIFQQTVRPHEIIFLDDASPDDSVDVARRLAPESPVPMRVIVNEHNSGSTFRQWMKGFDLASGDLIWIAESDDCASPDFLERLLPEFHDPEVVLAYSQSALIGPEGQLWAENFLAHTDDVSPSRWRSRYSATGFEEAEFALSQKNTIPNASAVVFRRIEKLDYAEELAGMRFAGDWLFYAMQIRGGKLAFVPDVLNYYRRHEQTVSFQSIKADTHAEETLHVKARVFETYSVSANAMARSLGQTLLEYGLMTERFGLKRPPLMANTRAAKPLNRIRQLFNRRAGARGELKILLVVDGAERGLGLASSLQLANALARDHQVYVCCASPTVESEGLAANLDERVVLFEGTLGATPWSTADPAGTTEPAGRTRVGVLQELIRFHQIDVIHSRFEQADRLVAQFNAELNIPWFVHVDEGRSLVGADWLSDEAVSTISGIFHEGKASIEAADERPALAGKRWIRMFNGLDPSSLREMQSSPIRKREGEFLVFLITEGENSQSASQNAMAAVQVLNRLPAAERGDRRVRLVLADAVPQPLLNQANPLLGRVDVSCAGQDDGAAILAQCDAVLVPQVAAIERMTSLVTAALACKVPVIAPDQGTIHEMLTHDRRRAGITVKSGERPTLAVDRMVTAMLRYLKQPELHAAHREDAGRLFGTRFHIDHTSAVCTEAYFHARDFLVFSRELRPTLSIQERTRDVASRESA